MVIGKGGEERVALQNKLTKEYGKMCIRDRYLESQRCQARHGAVRGVHHDLHHAPGWAGGTAEEEVTI